MSSVGENSARSRRPTHVVGIAEMVVSNEPEDILITYSLGSCIGLTLYDPQACVGGLIHCLLPLSRLDTAKAEANRSMFTDTGVPALVQAVLDMGASKKRLIAKVAGGGAPLEMGEAFRIGERNYTVLHKVLWKNDILIAAQDVGGTKPRTMTLYMETGMTTIKNAGEEFELT